MLTIWLIKLTHRTQTYLITPTPEFSYPLNIAVKELAFLGGNSIKTVINSNSNGMLRLVFWV